jgi:hypothetical protein
MRPDMKKVVVERPRGQSYVPNRKFGARLPYIPDHEYEEQPKRVGISESYRNYGYSEKWFSDLLGPLERFLQSNVGRPWNKVYSEICAGLDKRKATGKHVFDHLKCMVYTNCFIGANDKVCYLRQTEECEVDDLYVHPRTGLLCRARQENKREPKRRKLLSIEVTLLNLNNGTGYQKHEGLWYRVKLERVFAGWLRRKKPVTVRDIFLKRDVALGWGWHWVATEKKQCNHEELGDVRRLLAERERRIKRM